MGILLTDEGERYPYPTMGRDDELEGERDAFDAGAKAQLKKVVEFLLDAAERHGDLQAFFMYTDEGQALLKEVE